MKFQNYYICVESMHIDVGAKGICLATFMLVEALASSVGSFKQFNKPGFDPCSKLSASCCSLVALFKCLLVWLIEQ